MTSIYETMPHNRGKTIEVSAATSFNQPKIFAKRVVLYYDLKNT